jgi:hypothetical protein
MNALIAGMIQAPRAVDLISKFFFLFKAPQQSRSFHVKQKERPYAVHDSAHQS